MPLHRGRQTGSEVAGVSQPPSRAHLLEGVYRFVLAACRRREVLRIAMVGSLATAKSDPKDADVLVTVEPSADLATLARLGRTLKGHTQQRNRGADIFLAEPPDRYIGRTCQWRECAPGIRAACQADHCGLRHHLNDDLRVIALPATLVQAPPIELWPKVIRRLTPPADVEELLLRRLSIAAAE